MRNEVRREAVRYAVQRAITCPITGKILDLDHCFLIAETPVSVDGLSTAMNRLVDSGIEDIALVDIWRGRDGASVAMNKAPSGAWYAVELSDE